MTTYGVSSGSSIQGRLWSFKNRYNSIPGGYRAFRRLTMRHREGKVYTIRWGLMRGLRWERLGQFPYWYHLGLWEPQTTELLHRHLRPGDTFWDIGANAGYHSVFASRAVGPSGMVVAYEPDPSVAAILRRQLEHNGGLNVRIREAAIGDEVGLGAFGRSDNCLMSALGENGGSAGTIRVPITTLDAEEEAFGSPDVIKMDIEGGELDALRGGIRLLSSRKPPRILLSTHGPDIAAQCQNALALCGYVCSLQEGFSQMMVAVPNRTTV